MRTVTSISCGLVCILTAILAAGCRTPWCIVVHDLDSGQVSGVPILPNFYREMIVRVEPDGHHFRTVGRLHGRWFLRTYDMSGREQNHTDIGDCTIDYYSLIHAGHFVASVDGTAAVSITLSKAARDGFRPGRHPSDDLVVVLNLSTGESQAVPLRYDTTIAPRAYRNSHSAFTAGGDRGWVLFQVRPEDLDGTGRYEARLYSVGQNGYATEVFRHEGMAGSAHSVSLRGNLMAYNYDCLAGSPKDDSRIRIVRPEQPVVVKEIPAADMGLRRIAGLAMDGNGRNLAIVGTDTAGLSHLFVYDIAHGTQREILTRSNALGDVIFIGVSRLGVSCTDGLLVVDLATNAVSKKLKGYGLHRFFATPDGRYVIMQCN